MHALPTTEHTCQNKISTKISRPRRERNLASGIIFILKLIARALERKVMYIVRYVTVPCHTIHALQTCGNMSTGNTGRLFM